jgi:hypothetical protein
VSAVAERPLGAQLALGSERIAHERLRHSDGGRLTLEQRLESVWEGLSAAGVAECPLCGSRMERAGDHGRCGGCGSTLS